MNTDSFLLGSVFAFCCEIFGISWIAFVVVFGLFLFRNKDFKVNGYDSTK